MSFAYVSVLTLAVIGYVGAIRLIVIEWRRLRNEGQRLRNECQRVCEHEAKADADVRRYVAADRLR